MNLYIYISLSIYICVSLSIYIWISLSLSIYLSIYISIYLCIYLSIYLWISLSLYIYIYIYIYVYIFFWRGAASPPRPGGPRAAPEARAPPPRRPGMMAHPSGASGSPFLLLSCHAIITIIAMYVVSFFFFLYFLTAPAEVLRTPGPDRGDVALQVELHLRDMYICMYIYIYIYYTMISYYGIILVRDSIYGNLTTTSATIISEFKVFFLVSFTTTI